jgi:hypothetical protein
LNSMLVQFPFEPVFTFEFVVFEFVVFEFVGYDFVGFE